MMQPASVSTTVNYFDHVFKPRQLHTTPAQLQTALSTEFPAMRRMLTSLPALTH
jgi:hypothetical protein